LDKDAVKTSGLRWISPIKIMGKTYKVKRTDREDIEGEFDAMAQTIVINKTIVVADALADTLLHEVLHAIEYNAGLEFNEPYVRAFATGLIPVLRQNPDLLILVAGEYDRLKKVKKVKP
jgi:hypothetical protein